MKITGLNQRVTLQSITQTQSYGEVTDSTTDLATVWAEVLELSGRELVNAKQLNADTTLRVRIRYRTDVDSNCRVVWGSRILELTQPPINPDGKKVEHVLLCTDPQ